MYQHPSNTCWALPLGCLPCLFLTCPERWRNSRREVGLHREGDAGPAVVLRVLCGGAARAPALRPRVSWPLCSSLAL